MGSSGGTFQGGGGVYACERRLRFLLGLCLNDGRLIRPADEPVAAQVIFDWCETLNEALARRVELRRQKWEIKKAELALVAARNYLLPRLDGVALYRWRGFGNHLVQADASPDEFNNAIQNLLSGQFQESQLGLNLNVPIGFRQGIAAVRNAQLQVSRERAVLADQERLVANDLAAAVAEVDRAYLAIGLNLDRRLAADEQLRFVQEKYNTPGPDRPVPIEAIMDAQRRVMETDLSYHRSLVEYNLALKNVHFEKGSLLDYNEVYLSEGPWPNKAYRDADKRSRERSAAKEINYVFPKPPVFSLGPVDVKSPMQLDWMSTPVTDSQPTAPPAEVVAPPSGNPPPAGNLQPPMPPNVLPVPPLPQAPPPLPPPQANG